MKLPFEWWACMGLGGLSLFLGVPAVAGPYIAAALVISCIARRRP